MDEQKLGLHPDTTKIRALAAERNITTAAAAGLLRSEQPANQPRDAVRQETDDERQQDDHPAAADAVEQVVVTVSHD